MPRILSTTRTIGPLQNSCNGHKRTVIRANPPNGGGWDEGDAGPQKDQPAKCRIRKPGMAALSSPRGALRHTTNIRPPPRPIRLAADNQHLALLAAGVKRKRVTMRQGYGRQKAVSYRPGRVRPKPGQGYCFLFRHKRINHAVPGRANKPKIVRIRRIPACRPVLTPRLMHFSATTGDNRHEN